MPYSLDNCAQIRHSRPNLAVTVLCVPCSQAAGGGLVAYEGMGPAGISCGAFDDFISQKVFIKSFCKSQFPHESANFSFTITNIKNKLTDLCGN